MKQQSPLRKHQNYVSTEPAQRSTDTDQADWVDAIYPGADEPEPHQHVKDAARGLVAGLGLAAGITAIGLMIIGGNPVPAMIVTVCCMLGYLYIAD